jgi:hypothetical protein
MSINTEVVTKTYSNIVANVSVSVDMPLFAHDDLYVYYGSTRLPAVYGTDYAIVLSEPTYESFVFTPTSSLLSKIAAAAKGNVVYLDRVLNYTSDLEEADTFFRSKLVKAIDSIMMRFQQIAAYVKTGANHNITISTAAPSGGGDGDIWLKVPPT